MSEVIEGEGAEVEVGQETERVETITSDPLNLEETLQVDPETKEETNDEEEGSEPTSREDYIADILGEGYDQDKYEEFLHQAEKYNLTNEEIEKYNDIINDLDAEHSEDQERYDQDSEESMMEELSKLSEAEKAEVQPVFDFFENKFPDDMKGFFDKNFQTAEGFRAMKFMMEGMSQDLPNLEGKQTDTKQFGHEEYSEFSNKIRAATESLDFDGARLLKGEMMKAIKDRGTPEIKKDLAAYL